VWYSARGGVGERLLVAGARQDDIKRDLRVAECRSDQLIRAGRQAGKPAGDSAGGDLVNHSVTHPRRRRGVAEILMSGDPEDHTRPSFTRFQKNLPSGVSRHAFDRIAA
jgi:hypothetical protein